MCLNGVFAQSLRGFETVILPGRGRENHLANAAFLGEKR
jgi:hypothetical protein